MAEHSTKTDAAFRRQRDRVAAEFAAFCERVYEEIATQPVPVTAMELLQILDAAPDVERNLEQSTIRTALDKLEEAGRVIKRKETREEALVRGGGKLPKATRPSLYATGAEVPIRHRLPDGIEPRRPAQFFADEAKALVDQVADAVTRGEERRSGGGLRPVRSVKGLMKLFPQLTRRQLIDILERLERDGRVEKRDGRWYPSTGIRRPKNTSPASPLPPTQEAVTVGPVYEPPAPATPPAPPVPAPDENLQLVLDLAERLGVELPKLDTGRVMELETENARLRDQVEALKRAISTLT